MPVTIRVRQITFDVRGTGAFPVDMLRYDACWPASEADSHRMVLTHERTEPVTVKLRKHVEGEIGRAHV